MTKQHAQTPFVEKAISSIGSMGSLILHTIFFSGSFLLSVIGIVEWQVMLLVLTTVVSLEAIYMAIFIQIAVNRNTAQLREVEEDIEEIQEDVEELGEDLEDIQEDIEEISDDIDEIQEDVEELSEDEMTEQELVEKKKRKELEEAEDKREKAERRERKEKREREDDETALEELTNDVQKILRKLEGLSTKQ